MQAVAFSKQVQVAPRKVRLVAETIRNKKIDVALSYLSNLQKRGSSVLENTLKSAIANARDKKLSVDNLLIKSIDIMEGPSYKRFHPSTRGRTHPYKKRTSHIRIILTDEVQNSEAPAKEKRKEKIDKQIA